MKTSIILATYNANKDFLKEQLDSIMNQSVSPDEVLIFDDHSKNDTVLLIKDYIDSWRLDSWKLFVNEKNKGYQRNFLDGASMATGDIIFLSDQDDIWHRDRLKIMKEQMEKNKEISLLVCNFVRIYDDEYHCSHLPIFQVKLKKRRPSNGNAVTSFPGCTYCFTKRFFDDSKNGWVDGCPHDTLLYMSAWMHNSLYQVTEVLHFYRRHNEAITNNLTEFDKKNRAARLIPLYATHQKLLSKLEEEREIVRPNVYAFGKWMNRRILFLQKPSLKYAFSLFFSLSFYKSLKTYLVDVLPQKIFAFFLRKK